MKVFFLVYLGQERVRGLNRVYFKRSSGALVVYDVTNGSTLDGALNWKHELDGQVMLKNGRSIPAVLLANKCDETNVCQRNASLLEKLCQEKGFIGWFQTSAKVTHCKKKKKLGYLEILSQPAKADF